MNINSNFMKKGALGLGLAAGVTVAAPLSLRAKIAGNIARKPVGVPGSAAHVLSNDKLDKQAYTKDLLKTRAKSVGTAFGVAGAAAGLAAGVSKLAQVSAPVAKVVNGVKDTIGQTLAALPSPGKALKGLAEKVKTLNIPEKIKSLPKPAHSAILAGGAVLAAAAPVLFLKGNADAAYLEAKHETK